jgi:hypothetical protein
MEEAAFQNTAAPAFSGPSKKSPKRFYYLVTTIVIIVLVFVLYSRLVSAKKEVKNIVPTPTVAEKITITPTPEISEEITPTEAPTPTAKPAVNPVDKETGLDRSKLNIEVQNGSGVVGVAGKAADILKGLGYKVAGTANADNFDYTGVTIMTKSGSSDYGELLQSDLENSYTVSVVSNDLSATVSADAIVIIGK